MERINNLQHQQYLANNDLYPVNTQTSISLRNTTFSADEKTVFKDSATDTKYLDPVRYQVPDSTNNTEEQHVTFNISNSPRSHSDSSDGNRFKKQDIRNENRILREGSSKLYHELCDKESDMDKYLPPVKRTCATRSKCVSDNVKKTIAELSAGFDNQEAKSDDKVRFTLTPSSTPVTQPIAIIYSKTQSHEAPVDNTPPVSGRSLILGSDLFRNEFEEVHYPDASDEEDGDSVYHDACEKSLNEGPEAKHFRDSFFPYDEDEE